jgi:hypothetical protein
MLEVQQRREDLKEGSESRKNGLKFNTRIIAVVRRDVSRTGGGRDPLLVTPRHTQVQVK